MTNDNEKDNIIVFKPKKIVVEDETKAEIIANVFVKGPLIGLSVKDGLILLPPEAALELCMVLVSAMQVALDFKV